MKVDALYIKYVGFGEDVISDDFLFDFYRIEPSRKKLTVISQSGAYKFSP
jgi:hypothetical protein